MTKKQKAVDGLLNIVIDRYAKVGRQLTPDMANNVWYALLGEYERNGYEAAKAYAENAKLNTDIPESTIYGLYDMAADKADDSDEYKAKERAIRAVRDFMLVKGSRDLLEADDPADEASFCADLYAMRFSADGKISTYSND